jgi:glucose-6-phosphate-specific signal transduction histidine kinase
MSKTKEINLKCSLKVLNKLEQDLYKEISNLNFPNGFYLSLEYIIYEILANIKEHSFCKNVEIKIKITQKTVTINIIDDGIGLKQSYLKNGIFVNDDKQSIEMAFAGVSTKKRNERAFGLSSIRKLSEKLGGSIHIKTGTFKAELKKNTSKFSEINFIKGTDIFLNLPIKKINLYEIIK